MAVTKLSGQFVRVCDRFDVPNNFTYGKRYQIKDQYNGVFVLRDDSGNKRTFSVGDSRFCD